MKHWTADDMAAIEAAFSKLDLDLEVAKKLLSHMKAEGVDVSTARKALATAAVILGGAADWEDIEPVFGK